MTADGGGWWQTAADGTMAADGDRCLHITGDGWGWLGTAWDGWGQLWTAVDS